MKKTAAIVGLGVSGCGAALLLAKKGWEVKVTEAKDTPEARKNVKKLAALGRGVEYEIGGHTKDFIKGAQLVVTSPGVRDDSKPLKWARGLDIPVIDEIELGYRFCPSKIVAVTGTNGKSTTATLIGEVLRRGRYDVCVCGNIGRSFCEKVLGLKKDSIVVLEASSFQLQRVAGFRPYVSVFLNITQNHFDRHKDFKEYLNAKLNIFKNQKSADWAVVNDAYKGLKRRIRSRILYFGNSPDCNGAYLKEGAIYVNIDGKSREAIGPGGVPLKGEHNLKNSMAAVLVGLIFKVGLETIREALKNFKGLEHRFEYVDKIRGAVFINDSKATTVDAAMHAIRSITSPVILIAGGRDKGSDFTVLRGLIKERVKGVVLIGEAREKIKEQILGAAPIYEARDLRAAVSLGLGLAKKGDAVLLSPMCASFDMFKNFEERGDCYKKAVKSLKGRYKAAEL